MAYEATLNAQKVGILWQSIIFNTLHPAYTLIKAHYMGYYIVLHLYYCLFWGFEKQTNQYYQ